jgi:hypothetical protein
MRTSLRGVLTPHSLSTPRYNYRRWVAHQPRRQFLSFADPIATDWYQGGVSGDGPSAEIRDPFHGTEDRS